MPDPLDISRQWIELVLPGLTTVMYGQQSQADAPRPPLPYAMIDIEEDSAAGWQTPVRVTEDDEQISGKFVEHVAWTRKGELLVEIYGAGSVSNARALQLSLAQHGVIEFLKGEDVAIRHDGTVQRDPELRDTTWEEQAISSYMVSWVDSASSEVEAIETLNFTVSENP